MEEDAWLQKFRKEALPLIIREVHPEKVFAFGSRARGTATEESDLDIIIISKSFRDIPFLQRMPMILNRVQFAKHVDYLCYTPEEFRRVKQTSSILLDALTDPLDLAVS